MLSNRQRVRGNSAHTLAFAGRLRTANVCDPKRSAQSEVNDLVSTAGHLPRTGTPTQTAGLAQIVEKRAPPVVCANENSRANDRSAAALNS